MYAIGCKNVSKQFQDIIALQDVNFELKEGGIYALLGRNGAGKTTLMNCLCTKILPDKGEVQIFEENAYENEKMLSKICFMSDCMEEFDSYKISKLLKYAKQFYPMWDNVLEDKLLEFFEIDRNKKYVTLSKGKKTEVSVIIGLCSGCEIVLFDEIYSGMDAVARQQFYDILLKEYEKNPRTFVLSTHLIEEMSGIFSDAVIMDKGTILLNDNMENIREKSFRVLGRTQQEALVSSKNILKKREMGAMTEYAIYDDLDETEKNALEEAGFSISSLSLQDLFIAMTLAAEKEWGEDNGDY